MRKKVISVRKKRQAIATQFKITLTLILLIGIFYGLYYLFFVLDITSINNVFVDLPQDFPVKSEELKQKYLEKNHYNILFSLINQSDQTIFQNFNEFVGGKTEVNLFKKEVYLIPIIRTENAIWCVLEHDLCFSIDDTGFVIRKVSYTEGANILVIESQKEFLPSLGQKLKDEHLYFYIKKFHELLIKNNFLTIKYAVVNLTDFNVYLANGFFLKISSDIDVLDSLNYFLKVYNNLKDDEKKKLDYIDLRIGNKVFYKLKQ